MKNYVSLFILIIFTIGLNAQTVTLKGKVTTPEGAPVTGVNVQLRNSLSGTTTDNSGNFYLESGAVSPIYLVFTHVGYEKTTKVIEDINSLSDGINVILAPASINMGEVTVSATKYAKFMREEAIPVEVIDKDKFARSVPKTIADLADYEPGITIGKDGVWGTEINIRGLAKQNLVLLVDGNRVETSTAITAGMSLLNPEQVERVEVIKGGTSSLYGTGAMGGVVNIITKGGYYSDNLNYNMSLSSGYNSVNKGINNNITGTLGSNNWYLFFGVSATSASDAETPDGVLPNSSFRDNSGLLKVGFRPVKNHEIKISMQRFRASDVGIPGGEPFPTSAKATYLKADRDLYSAEYIIDELIPSMSRFSVKYFYQKITRDVELVPNPNARVNPNADHIMHGAVLNTYWKIAEKNIITAGIDIWQREYEGIRTRSVIPTNTQIFEKPVPDSRYRSAGLFVQNDISILNDRLNLRLGARYDYIDVTNDSVNNPLYMVVNGVRNDNPPIRALGSFAEATAINRAWSGNLSLLYKLTNFFDVTFNTGRSFRSPNLEERYQFLQLLGNTYLGNPDLEPETGNYFDLGFRLWNKSASFKFNAFYNKVDNLVIDQFDNNLALYIKQNVGEAVFYGYDLTTEFALPENFSLYGNLSYVRAEDLKAGTNLPAIPPLTSVISLRSPYISGALSFDLTAKLVSTQKNTATGENKTGGYAIYDLYLSSVPINLGYLHFKLYSGVENIFDRLYIQHLSTYRGIDVYEPGRNIFVKGVINL